MSEASDAPNQPFRLVLVVAAALLDGAGRVLVTQRPQGKAMAGLWEFPGGKVEPGETPEAALARELLEEIGVVVSPAAFTAETFVSHAYETFHLLMPLYTATAWTGDPRPLEVAAVRFVDRAGLQSLAMPPADAPLVERLSPRLR